MKKNKRITTFTKIYCKQVDEHKVNGEWVLYTEPRLNRNFEGEISHEKYYLITCDEAVDFFRSIGYTEEITRDRYRRVKRLVSTSEEDGTRMTYT